MRLRFIHAVDRGFGAFDCTRRRFGVCFTDMLRMLGEFTDLFLHKFGMQAHQFCKVLRSAHLGQELMCGGDVLLGITFYFFTYTVPPDGTEAID